MKHLFNALFAASLLWSPLVCAQVVEKGIPKENFFKMGSGGNGYNEVWGYNLYLDNGTKIWLNYSLLKSSLNGNECGSDIAIYNFKGKNYTVARSYDVKDHYVEDRTNGKVTIKNQPKDAFYMQGFPGNGHTIHFETEKKGGFYVRLQFNNVVPGVMPGDGSFTLAKGKKIGQYIQIPYGTISGKIAVGNDTLSVKGWGSMTHSWMNDLPAEISQRAAQVNSSKIAGKFALLNKGLGGLFAGYAVELKNGKASLLPITEVLADQKPFRSETTLPSLLTFKNGDWVWNMKRPVDQVVFSPLDNIDGFFAQKAVKMMMGGEIRLHRGVGTDASGNAVEFNMMRVK